MRRIIIIVLTIVGFSSVANAKCGLFNIGHCVDNLADAAKDVVTAGGHGRDRDQRRKEELIERQRIERDEKIKGWERQLIDSLETKNSTMRNIRMLEAAVLEADETAETLNFLSESLKEAVLNIGVSYQYTDQQARTIEVFKQEISKVLVGLDSVGQFHQGESFLNSLKFLSEVGLENLDEVNAAIVEIGKSLSEEDSIRIIELIEQSNRLVRRELTNYKKMLAEHSIQLDGLNYKIEEISKALKDLGVSSTQIH
jgi:hypothetical protein